MCFAQSVKCDQSFGYKQFYPTGKFGQTPFYARLVRMANVVNLLLLNIFAQYGNIRSKNCFWSSLLIVVNLVKLPLFNILA